MTSPRSDTTALRLAFHAASIAMLFASLFAPRMAAPASAQQLPAPIYETRSAIPADANRVLDALARRIQGEEAASGVGFDSDGRIDVSEPGFAYPGFRFSDASLFEYDQASAAGRIISGTMLFEDDLGRRALILVTAAYRLDGDTAVVLEAEAVPLFSNDPGSAVFIVPEDVVKTVGENLPQTYEGVLGFAIENALSWAKPEQVIAGPRRYVIFVFVRDRISPSASATVLIAESAEGKGGVGGGTRYLDDHGWRAAVLPGQFALDNANLFVKVVFKPGREAGFFDRDEKVVALYGRDFLAEQAIQEGYKFGARTGPEGGDAAGTQENVGVVAALPAGRYDGEWRMRLNINRGEPACMGPLNFKSRWVDGKIDGRVMHPYVGQVTITGEIDASGHMKVQGGGGIVLRIAGTADTDSTAEGTVDIIVAGFNCGGKWTAKKIGD